MRTVQLSLFLVVACLPIALYAQSADKPVDARPEPQVAPAPEKPAADLKDDKDYDARDNVAKESGAKDAGPKDADAKDEDAGEKSAERDKSANDRGGKDKDFWRATKSLRKAADEKAEQAYGRSYDRSVFSWMNANQGTVKGAWIGISTSPAAPALRKQLKLAEGMGLVVDFVEPKSPADQAGIKQYDLLEKLDDQLLVNSEQFAVLVRTFKAGDEVKLTLVREGKRQTIPVKLGEHELPRLMDLPQQYFQPLVPQPPGPMPATPPAAIRFGLGKAGGGAISVPSESSLTWLDGKQAITITSRDGHSTLTASDGPSGKVLYTRPIDTKEQRATLPRELRDKLSLLKLPVAEGDDNDQTPKAEVVPAAPSPDATPVERGR